eukprot:362948-Chlamydomonas_euryale.AAC.12
MSCVVPSPFAPPTTSLASHVDVTGAASVGSDAAASHTRGCGCGCGCCSRGCECGCGCGAAAPSMRARRRSACRTDSPGNSMSARRRLYAAIST